MKLWQVEHFFLHKKVLVVLYIQVHFCEEKPFNLSELHFSEVISCKIHTLVYLAHIFVTPLRSEFYEWKIPMFLQVKTVFFFIPHCNCFGLYYATNFVHLIQCDFVTSRTRMKLWHISAGFCIIASHLGRVWVKLPNQRSCLRNFFDKVILKVYVLSKSMYTI